MHTLPVPHYLTCPVDTHSQGAFPTKQECPIGVLYWSSERRSRAQDPRFRRGYGLLQAARKRRLGNLSRHTPRGYAIAVHVDILARHGARPRQRRQRHSILLGPPNTKCRLVCAPTLPRAPAGTVGGPGLSAASRSASAQTDFGAP